MFGGQGRPIPSNLALESAEPPSAGQKARVPQAAKKKRRERERENIYVQF